MLCFCGLLWSGLGVCVVCFLLVLCCDCSFFLSFFLLSMLFIYLVWILYWFVSAGLWLRFHIWWMDFGTFHGYTYVFYILLTDVGRKERLYVCREDSKYVYTVRRLHVDYLVCRKARERRFRWELGLDTG